MGIKKERGEKGVIVRHYFKLEQKSKRERKERQAWERAGEQVIERGSWSLEETHPVTGKTVQTK